ncbi:pimeloyl-[acyl-carrier protein] methyl ester esterase [Psychromonas sp. psych-6C06]|uniref:pimeloyl-ACP methyl ester esterase BioH n=1 Tax=Psychromonas sp. psych-6C06 TaxID=2058089 RepID=UPI000C3209CA|nr:pimeloyl-ACP methyl ester esterase BioH [Psychromonas sp. psych-6C06]PKF60267.1 pimeloyl-[acyl-carrier protein] methyl ester esterase [Psychromonas sp. psych-6C06]
MSIEQSVHCEVVGQGPALVLLHGWGVNRVVWQPVVESLSSKHQLYLVDLPGFGDSEPLTEYTLQSISEAILQVVPKRAIWCGWSLGGLIATYVAINYPAQVNKLIQVASSMKFVSEDDWSGVDASVFDNFLAGLKSNPDKTLTRFIALQAMGCASSRKDSVTFKKLLTGSKKAEQQALIEGLHLLAHSDLRSDFASITVPCLSLFGEFDSLVPLSTQKKTSEILPSVQTQLFENSSHAPFISENTLFCQRVLEFTSA